ncbi:MAG: DNRLRE domain-containing protein, partial [bacterium]
CVDVQLPANSDASIEEKSKDHNHSSESEIKVKYKAGEDKRGLLSFDLSALPAGATINSAELFVNVKDAKSGLLVELRRNTEEWVESEVTWDERSSGNSWSQAGGSFESAILATIDPSSSGSQGITSAALTDLIEDWASGAAGNYGLALVSDEQNAQEVKVYSSEDSSRAPYIDVEYCCPNTGTIVGIAWADFNGDSTLPADPRGVAGITIALFDTSTSGQVASTVTGLDGRYSFGCVADGNYTLTASLPGGISFSTQAGDMDFDSSGQSGVLAAGDGLAPVANLGITGVANIAGGLNGLFYGDGDFGRYTLLSEDPGLGYMYGLRDGSTMRIAFVAGPAMNDNVFDATASSYMAAADWTKQRTAKKLYDSEKLIDISMSCGSNSYQWTQSYLCKPSELGSLYPGYSPSNNNDFEGPLQGSGGLQESIEFQPASDLPSSATNKADYSFGDCGRDIGTPPPSYDSASSLAWNFNNSTWEPVVSGASNLATAWKSPYGATDRPQDDGYPTFGNQYLWEWPLVYEMAFDASVCGDAPITMAADSIHNSPLKGGSDATFPPAVITPLFFDFGDLPATNGYATTGADAARHRIVSSVYLGLTIDSEPDGQPADNAHGDNQNSADDEDGVTFSTFVRGSTAGCMDIEASIGGYLNAWLDWDGDGSFSSSEQIASDSLLSAGTNQICVSVPSSAVDSVYGRFRFTSDDPAGALLSSGLWNNGEVEDFLIAVTGDCGDGVLGAGEECDDGNTGDGDCCSASCTYESPGSACGDGADGECTNPDTCDASGACVSNDEAVGASCGESADGECTNPDT